MKTLRLHKPQRLRRGGFTLIELLVVIGVMIVLAVMTFTMVNVTENEDRVRAGAAQVQSYLEGARDRAIHAGEPRGVRFLPDANNPNIATSLIYIGAPVVYGDPLKDRRRYLIARLHVDPNTGVTNIYLDSPDLNGQNSDWENFRRRGLIKDGDSIVQINKKLYTFQKKNLSQIGLRYVLTADARPLNQRLEYHLYLKPSVLPNQEPRLLPRGVVVDLTNSKAPTTWSRDILFNPQGTVTDVEAAVGVFHLVVADQEDVDLSLTPGDPTKTGNERIVSVRTQTGSISVHNVDPTDTSAPAGAADDPFSYAARGESAR